MKFLRRFRTTFRLFGNPGITATAMAGSLLADLSRMGSDNAFTDLVLTAQGGLGHWAGLSGVQWVQGILVCKYWPLHPVIMCQIPTNAGRFPYFEAPIGAVGLHPSAKS